MLWMRLSFLLAIGALFFAGFLLGLRHMRRAPRQGGGAGASLGIPAAVVVVLGAILAAGMLVYRGVAARTAALPLSDHFDAFLLLAVLLAGAVVYLRWTRRFRSFAFFLLPMIGGLLCMGALLVALSPERFRGDVWGNLWTLLHIVTVIAGTLCFALGCVGGGVYLLAQRQLKGRGEAPFAGLPPLATIERFNLSMVYAGFPLLTLAMITGTLRLAQGNAAAGGWGGWHVLAKILLAAAAWVVYGVVAHVPLAPRLRGRQAAWLTIVGFTLFLATYAAVTWM